MKHRLGGMVRVPQALPFDDVFEALTTCKDVEIVSDGRRLKHARDEQSRRLTTD